MQLMAQSQTDQLLVVTKRAVRVCLMVTLLSTVFAYATYASDLGVSGLPWKISAVLAFVCCLAPLVIYFKCRGTNALWAYGMIILVGLFVCYYFFGIIFYYYFFIFAPLTAYLKWPGLVGGILLTAYWVVVTYRNVTHTIRATSFVEHAFEEDGEHINYQTQNGMKEFERRYKELNPFPKVLAAIVYGIAPFYLILNRVLSSNFGTNGVLLFLAVLGMPMSLWFVGALVRCYLVMVALPLRLERERHMRVVVDA